ncbi:MAG: N-formylglutamate amidohydrolase [bacterium]|nr:MAG: N-formylglutamate amidohydrolase [bacterium]
MGSTQFKFLEPSFYAGTAIHAGNRIRDDLQDVIKISLADRYREEDPGTEKFIQEFPIQIIARDSRFEYDINRSSDRAVYLTPDMAWGLNVWKHPLTQEEINISLAKHREFHQLMDVVVDYLLQQNKFAIIFDLHSYCYQREERLPWHVNEDPDINLGTEAMNPSTFDNMIKEFLNRLAKISVDGHLISVAENKKFKGGYLARRLCARNHDTLAVFAIEFKKIFMNEWTGEFYLPILDELINKFSVVMKEFIVAVNKK